MLGNNIEIMTLQKFLRQARSFTQHALPNVC